MKTRNFTAIDYEELKHGKLVDWCQQDKFSFGEEIVLVRPMVLLDIVDDVADHEYDEDPNKTRFQPLIDELKALEEADVLVCFDCQCNY